MARADVVDGENFSFILLGLYVCVSWRSSLLFVIDTKTGVCLFSVGDAFRWGRRLGRFDSLFGAFVENVFFIVAMC